MAYRDYDGWDDYRGWRPYVSVAERRRKAEREMQKRKKQGHAVSPVIIEGRAIVKTFWGKSWCENLERLQRLCKPLAARTDLCAQRFGGRSAD